MTGGKGLTTDAGTHVPLVARWTGTIQAAVNGRLYDVPNGKLEENPIPREDDSTQTGNARQRLTKVLKSME